MVSHRILTTLKQDGTLTLSDLPFHAGEAVEVIVVPLAPRGNHAGKSLLGTPVTYLDPFDPVGVDDWDVTR